MSEIEEIQVVLPKEVQEPFKRWLASHGLHLFPMPPFEDDLPTYGIGISEEALRAATEETENRDG